MNYNKINIIKNISAYPGKLEEILSSSTKIGEKKGRLGDVIIKYLHPEGRVFYLKYGEGKVARAIESEALKLKWLEDKEIQTPKIEYYYFADDIVFLLISNIEGKPAHEQKEFFETRKIISIAAKALKKLHQLNLKGALSFRYTLQSELLEIDNFVREDLIEVQDFKKANQGKTPQEILVYLQSKKAIFQENVFTHGDFCFPNLIIKNENDYGFVDWAKGGVADQHRDFSAMEVSIGKNFGEEYIDWFYEAYDIPILEVDREKIRYYQLVDQFFYYQTKETIFSYPPRSPGKKRELSALGLLPWSL